MFKEGPKFPPKKSIRNTREFSSKTPYFVGCGGAELDTGLVADQVAPELGGQGQEGSISDTDSGEPATICRPYLLDSEQEQ